jgi:hypothetical protein
MALQNRVNLKSYFLTGSKPTQSNFADFIDSTINISDDGISVDSSGNVSTGGGVSVKGSVLTTPGTIAWNGTSFQFRDNSGWQTLTLGSAGSSQWTTVGSGINLLTGGAGIGLPAATPPTYKFEVTVGITSASPANTGDCVRLGGATFFQDAFRAYFSHRGQAGLTSYGLSQDSSGNTNVNAATGMAINFSIAGTPQAAFSGGALNIGGAAATPGALLLVNGNAAKPGGGPFVITGSDARLKTDICEFTDGLKQLKKLKPVNYRYNGKAGISSASPFVGLIAQEVLPVFPYMVGRFMGKLEETDQEETELLNLDVGALTYVIVNAIKELDARLEKLESKKTRSTVKI